MKINAFIRIVCNKSSFEYLSILKSLYRIEMINNNSSFQNLKLPLKKSKKLDDTRFSQK